MRRVLLFVFFCLAFTPTAFAVTEQINDVVVKRIVSQPGSNVIKVMFSESFDNDNKCSGGGVYGVFNLDDTSKTNAMLSLLLAAATSKTTMSVTTIECSGSGSLIIYQVRTNY